MSYRREIAIEFNHCDPAGIVFYPRYFEMVNSVVENFFGTVLGYSFARMSAERVSVPTVHLTCDFHAPSRLGERVVFTLEVERIGSRSVTFRIGAAQGDERRLSARSVLVWVGADGRAAAWPQAIRAALEQAMEKDESDD